MTKRLLGLISAMLLMLLPGPALADAAGTAKGVDPQADALRGTTIQTLVVGSDIFLGDKIHTGPKGLVQILFADNTKMVVGPDSSLTIEDYLLRNDGSAGKFVVDMLTGSFRFATGNAPKNKYQINTPTGTIGIRGTAYDVFVEPDGTTWILLYHGALRFCSNSGQCEEITDVCAIGQYDATQAQNVGTGPQTVGAERKSLQERFRYAMDQSPLLREFWEKNSFDCLHKAPDVPPVEEHHPDPKPRVPDGPPECEGICTERQ